MGNERGKRARETIYNVRRGQQRMVAATAIACGDKNSNQTNNPFNHFIANATCAVCTVCCLHCVCRRCLCKFLDFVQIFFLRRQLISIRNYALSVSVHVQRAIACNTVARLDINHIFFSLVFSCVLFHSCDHFEFRWCNTTFCSIHSIDYFHFSFNFHCKCLRHNQRNFSPIKKNNTFV